MLFTGFPLAGWSCPPTCRGPPPFLFLRSFSRATLPSFYQWTLAFSWPRDVKVGAPPFSFMFFIDHVTNRLNRPRRQLQCPSVTTEPAVRIGPPLASESRYLQVPASQTFPFTKRLNCLESIAFPHVSCQISNPPLERVGLVSSSSPTQTVLQHMIETNLLNRLDASEGETELPTNEFHLCFAN